MKLKKILLSFAAIIVSLFAVNTVKAAPGSFTVNASDLHMLYGSNYLGNGSTLNFSYKVNSNGQLIYCTEIHDAMPQSGSETYTLSREMDGRFGIFYHIIILLEMLIRTTILLVLLYGI